MLDVETLGVPTINHDTIERQFASDKNIDKRRTSGKCEGTVQTEGREPISCTSKMQGVDVQIQCNANHTTEPGIGANPMFMGINNNESFFSEQIKEDDKETNVRQANQRNNNDNNSFISEQIREDDMKTNVSQMKKKQRQEKKNNLKIGIPETNTCSHKQETIDKSKLQTVGQMHGDDEEYDRKQSLPSHRNSIRFKWWYQNAECDTKSSKSIDA